MHRHAGQPRLQVRGQVRVSLPEEAVQRRDGEAREVQVQLQPALHLRSAHALSPATLSPTRGALDPQADPGPSG
eukprot:3094581-Rhodomonas_salina.1